MLVQPRVSFVLFGVICLILVLLVCGFWLGGESLPRGEELAQD